MGLPPDWWKSAKWRKEAPADYFLDPKNRRYPYKTHTGEISCARLWSAIVLARMHGDKEILKKALKLYNSKCRG